MLPVERREALLWPGCACEKGERDDMRVRDGGEEGEVRRRKGAAERWADVRHGWAGLR